MTFPVAQPVRLPVSASTVRATHLAAVPLRAAVLYSPIVNTIGRPGGKQASGSGRSSAAGSPLPRTSSPEVHHAG